VISVETTDYPIENILFPAVTICRKVSISTTLYVQLFCAKMFCTAFP
jgi:hypothetical protein